jgi:hypothetical protein
METVRAPASHEASLRSLTGLVVDLPTKKHEVSLVETAPPSAPTSTPNHPTCSDAFMEHDGEDESIESAIPVCTRQCGGLPIGHRAAFVLMHVDGTTDVRSIAKMVGLPLADVIACFEELVDVGLVDLGFAESGVFRRSRDLGL